MQETLVSFLKIIALDVKGEVRSLMDFIGLDGIDDLFIYLTFLESTKEEAVKSLLKGKKLRLLFWNDPQRKDIQNKATFRRCF